MPVAANITFFHIGTHASVPAAFPRNTNFDGRYVLGAASAADGGTNGGSATHTHPDATNHLHAITFSGTSYGLSNDNFGLLFVSTYAHTHAGFNSSNAAVVFGTASNDPPYYEVIFVKSDGTSDVTDGLCAFFDEATLPTDWNELDGASGRPDLRNKFLKGAATGSNAGATGGSLDAHGHNSDHVHNNIASSNSVGRIQGAGSAEAFCKAHVHQTSIQSTSANVQTADGQPPFRKLMAIQNNTGVADTPDKIIGIWDLALADIPVDWEPITDQQDKFLKTASGSGEIGVTGGADQHYHTCAAHAGTATVGSNNNQQMADGPGAGNVARDGHNHPATVGNATVTVANCTAKSNYPLNRTAILIKYTKPLDTFISRLTVLGAG